MSATFDPAPAAGLLADAFKAGRQIAEIPAGVRPKSLAEAYAIQDAFIAGCGDKTSGWKLGLGSRNAMKGAGLERPVIGRVLQSRLYRNGDTVRLAVVAPILVETEICVVLGRDIAPTDKVAPRDAIATAHIAAELVQSRLADRKTAGVPSLVADSVAFAALIVGQPVDIAKVGEIVSGISVMLDGLEVARGLAGDDGLDPLEMIAVLMAHARERGVTLRKGELVTTGTITKPFDIVARMGAIVTMGPGLELVYQTSTG